jgi:hypothetical protein
MHTVKRKLSQHLPGNSYKSSDPEFNKLRDAFKDVIILITIEIAIRSLTFYLTSG